MVIWIILLAMTAAAVMAVLWPLSRHRAVRGAGGSEHAVLPRADRRDRARPGARRAAAGEAEAAKAEAGRRLLRATGLARRRPCRGRRAGPAPPPRRLDPRPLGRADPGARDLRRLRLAAYPAEPPAAPSQRAGGQRRSRARRSPQIETHLAKNPQDGRGWEVIAPVYLRMGRMDDAVKAYEAALRHLGAGCRPLSQLRRGAGDRQGRARLGGGAGRLRAGASSSMPARPRRASISPARPSRTGRSSKAKAAYTALLAASPADAPWVAAGEASSSPRLDAPQRCRSATPRIGPEAIAGMVAGLASRLEAQGGSAEEWARLMRSYAVLGQRDKAVGRSPARPAGPGAGRCRPRRPSTRWPGTETRPTHEP